MGNIFLEYAPVIYMDKLEPFKIRKVGVSAYTEDGCGSRSFNRTFDFSDFEGTATVVEYAYYLDYDIQHLYDLEHIWVYLDKNGNVIGAEGSYHGRFLNAFNNEFTRFYEKTGPRNSLLLARAGHAWSIPEVRG